MNSAKLLVVGGEASVRENLRSRLEELGYSVAVALSGEEGLAVFPQSPCEIVMAGVHLPDMTLAAFVGSIQNKDPHTPIVIMTSRENLTDALIAVHSGAWDCQIVPVEQAGELEVLIRRNLERARLLVENLTYREHSQQPLDQESRRLQESGQRIRAIFDSSFEFIGLLSPEGIVLEANRSALEFAGVELSEVVGKPFWETPWWRHSTEMKERLRAAILAAGKGELQRFEATHVAQNNEIHFIDFSLKPVTDESGQVMLLVPEGRDITERKQAEEALRKQLAFDGIVTRTLSRFAGCSIEEIDGHIQTSLEEIGRYMNADMAHLVLAAADFSTWGVAYYWRGPGTPEIAAKYKKVPRGSHPYMEKKILLLGEAVYMYQPEDLPPEASVEREIFIREGVKSILNVPFRGRGGVVRGAVGLRSYNRHVRWSPDDIQPLMMMSDAFANTLERKQAEEALRYSQQRLALHIQQTPFGVIEWNQDFEVVRWNPAAEKIFGYSFQEAVGKHFSFIVPESSRLHVDQVWDNLLQHRGGEQSRNANIAKNGQIIFCEWYNTLLTKADGQLAGIASLVHDITHEQELERQLRISQKHEALGRLAGGIAHDFNNILGSIIGYADLSRTCLDQDHPVNEFQNQIFAAGNRAKELVKQILLVAKQQEQERIPISAHLIVNEVVQLIKNVTPTTIAVRTNIESKSLGVLADPTQIHQVLLNLCTNANHAMREHGGILGIILNAEQIDEMEAKRIRNLKPGAYVRLQVSDTGHGMDDATMEKIFDPYFTTKAPGEGTGLGLAVVQGIVESHEGFITVKSEVGKGSAFTVYLPRILAPSDVPITPIEEHLKGIERILLVDDEPMLLEVGKIILEHLGYSVTTVRQSPEALELFHAKKNEFDMLITDHTMPHITGINLAKAVLSIRPDMPIILCTGYSDQIDRESAMKAGIAELLLKPLSIATLGKAVRSVLERKTGKQN